MKSLKNVFVASLVLIAMVLAIGIANETIPKKKDEVAVVKDSPAGEGAMGYAPGGACGEALDGGSFCVEYAPDPELKAILKMCKKDRSEDCRAEKLLKLKAYRETRLGK